MLHARLCLITADPLAFGGCITARAASPSVAAVIRSDLLEAANCLIRAVDDSGLVFSSARKA